MKKNVVFWVGVKSSDPLLNKKHGGFEYFQYSKNCWEYWCKKNNIIFYEYNTPLSEKNGTTWTRWFDVFPYLENENIDFDKICVVDGSTMIKWDAPNFFDECPNNKLTIFRALENLKWVYEGVQGYKNIFNNFDFDITKYIDCGFQIFDKSHKPFLNILEEYHDNNFNKIMECQNTIKRGTDQPIYNFLLQIHNINTHLGLSPAFMLNHLNRFDWLSHNWQLKTDTTPFFIKYGYIWKFSGFDRTQRQPLMKQTWDLIKQNYE
tara:strand:+ start:1059 stop:1847 length:789 start_codon:yes stop_codon:yes gene_type:complete